MTTNNETFGYKFWMVFHVGGNPPRKSHSTKKEAQEEAKRLSGFNPNQRYVVLEAVECYQSEAVVNMKVLENAPQLTETEKNS